MDTLARTYETAANCLEQEAHFLAIHHQLSEAAEMRKQAERFRQKAARCWQHAHNLQAHAASGTVSAKRSFPTLRTLFHV